MSLSAEWRGLRLAWWTPTAPGPSLDSPSVHRVEPLYRALWSPDIIDELRRNLIEAGLRADSVDRLIGQMRQAFPDAEVTGYRSIIDGLTCDPKDRHVLAAAVRSDASAIVTFNEGDFPAVSVQPFEIEVIHPDAFLLDQLDLARDAVIDELRQQAAVNRQSPKTVPDILDALARAGAPRSLTRFAGRSREDRCDEGVVVPEPDANRVRRWAAEKTPPEFRDEMRVEVDETQRGLTIFECRPPWSELVGPEWTRMPLARLTYVNQRNEWTLYWADRNGRFQRYWECDPSLHVGDLLAEIDNDSVCIFWG